MGSLAFEFVKLLKTCGIFFKSHARLEQNENTQTKRHRYTSQKQQERSEFICDPVLFHLRILTSVRKCSVGVNNEPVNKPSEDMQIIQFSALRRP